MRAMVIGAGLAAVVASLAVAQSAPFMKRDDDLEKLAASMERSRLAYENFVLRSPNRAPVEVIVCRACGSDDRAAEPPRRQAARETPPARPRTPLASTWGAARGLLVSGLIWPFDDPPALRGTIGAARG